MKNYCGHIFQNSGLQDFELNESGGTEHILKSGNKFENKDGDGPKPQAYMTIRRRFWVEPDTVIGAFHISEVCSKRE